MTDHISSPTGEHGSGRRDPGARGDMLHWDLARALALTPARSLQISGDLGRGKDK